MSNFSHTDKNTKGWFSLGKWQPTTRACGFIHASLEDTSRALVEWKTPLVAEYDATLQVHEIKGGLADAFKALLPLQTLQPSKYLLLPTVDNEWTAIFDNDIQGTEPHSLVAVMNRRYGYDSIEAIDTPHTLSKDKMQGKYGCVAFIYQYDKDRERWVRCMRGHSRWGFDTIGDPLPFEDLSLYDQPQTTERFNHDILLKYLLAMGVDASNEAFYMPDGRAIIVEEIGQNFR